MIALLEGTLAEKAPDHVVLSVNGVGYEVQVAAGTLAALPPPGKRARLFTRLHVREDAMVLYGFASPDERTLFDHLVSVNGVGPKLAMAVLSVLTPESLRRAIATGDVDALTLVPGVGRKVAARVILDLKDRLGAGGAEPVVTGSLAEVREALQALGISGQEAREALAALGPDGDRPVEDLLREALQSVGR
jgi:Holliday junction DNA helicase RuvA